MIWGIHYFITKLKTKIDVIPRSFFKNIGFFQHHMQLALHDNQVTHH